MKQVVIAPLITEQSMAQVKQGKFSFKVSMGANKEAIRKAVKGMFNVDVISIETVVQKGGTQRVGIRRMEKKIQPTKKAIVTLKEGQKIDIFDLGV